MEIKVYLHRTKKKKFEVADCFSVFVDLDKLPEDIADDLEYINAGFKNDAKKAAYNRPCIKKYGTGYVSFMVPKYEGPEEENGNDKYYFDNKEMLFMKRKPKRTRKKKEEATSEEK